jgi:hypothetical protein
VPNIGAPSQFYIWGPVKKKIFTPPPPPISNMQDTQPV